MKKDMEKSSMEVHNVESQSHTHQELPFTKNSLSPSSSSSSFSSSSSSASFFGAVPPITFSSVQTEITGEEVPHYVPENGESSKLGSSNEWFRFFGIMGNGSGIEWKDIENRFHRISITNNGSEPVLKWSDFGFCIGEKT